MKKLYSNDSDLINKINIDDLQKYITAGCYYLDDITLQTDSQAENATQKIMSDKFFSSGKII